MVVSGQWSSHNSSCSLLNNLQKKTYFVTPGVQPTLHAFPRVNELMMELLPTFGIPTMPTRIDVFIPLLRQ